MTLGLSTIVGLLTMLATPAVAGGAAVAAAQPAGCAATTSGTHVTGTGPAPTASCVDDAITGEPSVTLTEADNGKTITLRIGQTLGISLPAAYRPTAVSAPALVKALTRGGYPTDQPLFEVYRTGTAGSADVSTMTDYACLHTTPRCALPQRLWRVHVDVVGIGG
ncbi:hypothetical protein DI270_008755 [Microbispora triticiradicis]|uniref:Uncharacterized protein n=1 Tax=Microbispora triticiradicis TaxID=2200763 RepID=A0ABX9LQJ7_9ACTN|nr:hypothetical protein [Microbispora triticiradicis]RGA05294.1 hypothetical protein DI270_008755 [Microbispora triticiradicis]